jgi:membrane protease YdiL (CAAX protease family)
LLCVVTPILEEFTFRGILLPRWTHKWGVSAGVLTSSALFAALHSDPFGAFVFGIAMCILYLKSQSLTLSMLCHGLYNFAVWLLDLVDELTLGPEYVFTLEELQASCPGASAQPRSPGFGPSSNLYRPKSDVPWRLPVA